MSDENINVINSFGTGLQLTEVARRTDGSLLWIRRPGNSHPGHYPRVPGDFVDRADSASGDRLAFALPVLAEEDRAVWAVPGTRTLAEVMVRGSTDGRALSAAFRDIGAGLARLHDLAVDDEARPRYPPPRWPKRLSDWLHSGRAPRAGAGWHVTLRRQLGAYRWKTLIDMTTHMTHSDRCSTVLHGWPSMGSVVLGDERPGDPGLVVLSGLEASTGRIETDLACLCGELIEFGYFAREIDVSGDNHGKAITALLDGYGPRAERSMISTGAVVRIATHAHDFASYVGWSPDLDRYVRILIELLDSGGATIPADTEPRMQQLCRENQL